MRNNVVCSIDASLARATSLRHVNVLHMPFAKAGEPTEECAPDPWLELPLPNTRTPTRHSQGIINSEGPESSWSQIPRTSSYYSSNHDFHQLRSSRCCRSVSEQWQHRNHHHLACRCRRILHSYARRLCRERLLWHHAPRTRMHLEQRRGSLRGSISQPVWPGPSGTSPYANQPSTQNSARSSARIELTS